MEDIRETAKRLAGDVDQWLKAGNSVGNLSEHAVSGLADTFERAILSERERCAEIIQPLTVQGGVGGAYIRRAAWGALDAIRAKVSAK